MPLHFFLPRWVDETTTNSQNLSAKGLLSRFRDPRARWTAVCSEKPAESVQKNGVDTIRLTSTRFEQLRLALAYQSDFDAVVYSGPHWGDEFGLKLRNLCRRRIPVLPTFEGVIATSEDLRQLSEMVGHKVFSEPFADWVIPRLRYLYGQATHIIAISPFLVRVAKFLYGDKVSCLPLGVEGHIFHSVGRREPERCRVICCGSVKPRKNPQIFLQLAQRYKDTDFVWYGDGVMRQPLILEAQKMGVANLRFPGAIQPAAFADELRSSSIFVIPSYAEGVPKVTNEAAACGLPILLNGFYEATTVVHDYNGLVAWSDEQLMEHVGTLIRNPEKRAVMGQRGAEMAKQWDWNVVAPQWEDLIIRTVSCNTQA